MNKHRQIFATDNKKRVYNSIVDLIGNIDNPTPVVMLNERINPHSGFALGLKPVPVAPEHLGSIAKQSQPRIYYALFEIPEHPRYSTEQQSYLLRKICEQHVMQQELRVCPIFCVNDHFQLS